MKKVLGLDIGITSVGWGIIDLDDEQYRDCGVRLFTEATAANNVNRRSFRGSRRLKSRRKNRKEALLMLLERGGLYNGSKLGTNNPYELRCKGLHTELTNEELTIALLHICKRRGSALDVVEADEGSAKDDESVKLALQKNDALIKQGKFVCEIQQDSLQSTGKVRGSANNFRSSHYKQEAEALLERQNIDPTLSKSIIDCIFRKRHFSEGPGSYASPTPYGRFNLENGKIVKIDLIEKMRGRCSLFPMELRAPKNSYSAEVFNLLNDLNNLSHFGEKLNHNQKLQIVSIAREKGKITPNQLAKLWGYPLEDITGFRIDKSEKPLLTPLSGFYEIKKILIKTNATLFVEDNSFYNHITEILTRTKVLKERYDAIKEAYNQISDESANALANLSKISGFHSLSFKAMDAMISELFETEMNQMQIIHTLGLHEHKANQQQIGSKIYFDEDAVLSPVAKQAHREAIKVINQLRKKHGEFHSIVIETTRSKNSMEQKKAINDSQKFYENQNKKLQELLGDSFTRMNAKQKMKVNLYLQQDGKCLYTGETLELNAIINDPTRYEVDHIIPISISLDDSINNKMLCTNTANREKGNLTPYRAFHSQKFGSYTYSQYKTHVLSLGSKLGKKKISYLLFEEDITKIEVQKGFIARNLVDTSYANRLVLNTLQEYFKINHIDTKVFTIKGSATAAYRKRIKLKKDRDLHYGHHAVDALLVACIQKQNVISKQLDNYQVWNNETLVNAATGEVMEGMDIETFMNNKFISFVRNVVDVPLRDVKFSHKVDRKVNRQIADQTIYSTRVYDGDEYVVKKYKNIYDKQFTKLSDDISMMLSEENPDACEKYQMYKHDPRTFEKLVEVVKAYEDEFGSAKANKVNPFFLHLEQHGEYITKYSKKGNGPVVNQIKYTDGKLGNHIDLSKNYNVENKKVVLQQISPFRTDFYQGEKGYKFITVRYSNIRFISSKEKYCIDQRWYEQQKKNKGISDTDNFIFSLHHNEILGIMNKNPILNQKVDNSVDVDLQQHIQLNIDNFDKGMEIVKFTATNNDNKNQIEVKPIHFYEKKQLMPTVGKSTNILAKYHVSAIGETTQVTHEELKLEF